MVRLIYGNSTPNVGDYFSFGLAKKLYKKVEYSTRPNLAIAGSILNFRELSNDTIIGGVGAHNIFENEVCHITKKENFKAVRGKLTAERLGLDLTKVALGDPGLLASRYFHPPLPITKKKFCILAHGRDYEKLNKIYGSSVDVINMATNNVERILTTINQYNLVFSTSLHGLIFAHSYGIPAFYLEENTPESKEYFKFKDYYSVLDINFSQYKLTNDLSIDLSFFSSVYRKRSAYVPSKECVSHIQESLLACCPTEEELSPKRDAVICAIAKNENKYINDWVNYYLKIGFDHIYLFDNNSSQTKWVAREIDQIDKVTIFDVRDVHKEGLQLECYTWFYRNYCNTFDGTFFVDIDEFLFGIDHIKTFLSRDIFKQYEMIRVKGKLFGDDDLISRDLSIPVYQAFSKEIHNDLSNQAKCFVRGGLSEICIGSCHYAYRSNQTTFTNLISRNHHNLKPLKECLPSGERCFSRISIEEDYSKETVFLHHYMTKTLSEFLEQKLNRGDACFDARAINMDYFGRLNKRTDDKIKYVNDYLKSFNSKNQSKKPQTLYADSSLPKLAEFNGLYK